MNKNSYIYIAALGCLLLLCLTYANHFDNGFYFDDGHTITRNEHIKSINLKAFFTDPATFSTKPGNQSYRPITTLMNAIDYQLAGKAYNPYYYHRTIFLLYLLQLVLTYFLFRGIMNIAWKHKWNTWIALFATAFYAFHTINAETVNYIISRSDGLATLCTIATLLMYQYQPTKRFFLYLIPLVLGVYAKQTGVMTAPLLLLYIAFFEEKITWEELKKFNKTKIGNILKKSLPAMIIAFGLIFINQIIITETSGINVTVSKFHYFITQLYVITYYYSAFFFPVHLSADPDFKLIKEVFDSRVILGTLFHLGMLFLSFKWFKDMKTRPIAFGVLWFYIALAPTSSFAPLYQMANDHRLYFPIVGLCLATTWFIGLQVLENQGKLKRNPTWLYGIMATATLIIGLYAYGTYQRNEVWGTSESLWQDVVIKSPENGRGWMNFGLTKLRKKDNKGALACFDKAYELVPNYSTLQINYGAVKQRLKYPKEEIEKHYQRAVNLEREPATLINLGRYVYNNYKDRKHEGFMLITEAYKMSPANASIKKTYEKVKLEMNSSVEERIAILEKKAKEEATSNSYMELGRQCYDLGKYKKSAQYSQKAVELDASNLAAHNNLCIAYCRLKKWKAAVKECEAAIKLDPNFKLAKNNLKWAKDGLAGKYDK